MKEFNSQFCTTKEQSQRLLELGLKPETADMVLIKELAYDAVAHCTYDADTYMIRPIDYLEGERHRGHIPTWSLHRLMEIGNFVNVAFLDVNKETNSIALYGFDVPKGAEIYIETENIAGEDYMYLYYNNNGIPTKVAQIVISSFKNLEIGNSYLVRTKG